MGKIKELYIEIMNANDGNIPEEATIADLQKMKDLETFEWKEYEHKQEKIREWVNQSENSKEKAKTEQTIKKFSSYYGKTKDKRNK
jgi:hypothetical protein